MSCGGYSYGGCGGNSPSYGGCNGGSYGGCNGGSCGGFSSRYHHKDAKLVDGERVKFKRKPTLTEIVNDERELNL